MSACTKDYWVDVISKEQMPIFGITAGKLAALSVDSKSSSAEVAQVILSDPTMTTRILQVANTVYYNPTSNKINTISRAVVILGFDKIHAICISVTIIDALLRGPKRDRLIEEVAKSLHAAVQAKSYVQLMGDGPAEEVFIAALLYHLGEMAFWCFGDAKADELSDEMNQNIDEILDIQREILGFTLRELTQDLATTWKLSDTLFKALDDSKQREPWIECIVLAHDMVTALSKGWDSPELMASLKKIAKHVHLLPHQVNTIVQKNAEEALRQAKIFKVPNAKNYIPTYETISDISTFEQLEDSDPHKFPVPDEHIQLDILRDLSELMHGVADINIVLNLVLEGLHRGVGLDRVMVAFPTKDKKYLAAKFILEVENTNLKQDFFFKVHDKGASIFHEILISQSTAWVGNKAYKRFNDKLNNELTRCIGTKVFFVAPVIYHEKSIGLFYADRKISGRELDEAGYRGFEHFVREANKAIASF